MRPSIQGQTGRLIKNSIQCSLSGTPTFSNTSSVSFRFRFRGLLFTRTHLATWSSKTTGHFKHRTTDPEGRPSARETNDRQPRDIAFLGFTWGSHRHPSGLAGPPQRRGPSGLRRAEAATFAPAAPSVIGPICRPRAGGSQSPRTRAILPTAATRRSRPGSPRQGCNARPTARGGREPKDRAARTHLGAHLPHEPALRPGQELPLQRLRGKGTESSFSREPPQPPSPAPHQLGAPTPYLARGRWRWEPGAGTRA